MASSVTESSVSAGNISEAMRAPARPFLVRTMWDPLLGSSFADNYFMMRDYCLNQQWSHASDSVTSISKHPILRLCRQTGRTVNFDE
ncbi:hypothetical protein ABVT39_027405 [Epinephelus coioides]